VAQSVSTAQAAPNGLPLASLLFCAIAMSLGVFVDSVPPQASISREKKSARMKTAYLCTQRRKIRINTEIIG
jgi:hypothetical protein